MKIYIAGQLSIEESELGWSQYPSLHLIGAFTNREEAQAAAKSHSYDSRVYEVDLKFENESEKPI